MLGLSLSSSSSLQTQNPNFSRTIFLKLIAVENPVNMEVDTVTDSRIQKVNSLLKDIRIDYDSLSKPVDSFVSSIREAIDAIPEGFKVDSCFPQSSVF